MCFSCAHCVQLWSASCALADHRAPAPADPRDTAPTDPVRAVRTSCRPPRRLPFPAAGLMRLISGLITKPALDLRQEDARRHREFHHAERHTDTQPGSAPFCANISGRSAPSRPGERNHAHGTPPSSEMLRTHDRRYCQSRGVVKARPQPSRTRSRIVTGSRKGEFDPSAD